MHKPSLIINLVGDKMHVLNMATVEYTNIGGSCSANSWDEKVILAKHAGQFVSV